MLGIHVLMDISTFRLILKKDLKTSYLIAKQENCFVKQQYEMIDINNKQEEHIDYKQ